MTTFVNLGEGFVLPLDAVSFVAPDQDDSELYIVTLASGEMINLDKEMFSRFLDAMRVKFTVLEYEAAV